MSQFFEAEVRDLKDEKQSGMVKVRIYGHHDDEQNVKDDHLPWALPLQSVRSAATGRVGQSPTGLVVGSRVLVTFSHDDKEMQHPIIVGSFARVGSPNDKSDNTNGLDDVNDKDSDLPLASRDKGPGQKTLTQSEKISGQNIKPGDTPKYNEAPFVTEDTAKDGIKEAKQKFALTGDKPTVASIDKQQMDEMLPMIRKVDPNNQSAVLPQAVVNLMKILQMGGMTNTQGVNNLVSKALSSVFQSVAGNNNLSALINQLGSVMNMNQDSVSGNLSSLLNQLGGLSPQNSTVQSIPSDQQEILYVALLNLLNQTNPDLSVNPPKSQIKIAQPANNSVLIPQTYLVASPPDGYFQVFSFTDIDPFPGYIEWEGPNGEIVFTVRPTSQPYAATPEDDVINSAIEILLEDLLLLISQGKLTLQALLDLLTKSQNTAQAQGTNNALGQNVNLASILNFAIQILGQLGSNIIKATTDHIPPSVLDKPKTTQALQKYTLEASKVKKKIQPGAQAVSAKAADVNGLNGSVGQSGLLSFQPNATGFSSDTPGVNTINPLLNKGLFSPNGR